LADINIENGSASLVPAYPSCPVKEPINRRSVVVVVVACTFAVGLLHGDMSQVERNEVITAFKHKSMPILAATDVAGMIENQLIY